MLRDHLDSDFEKIARVQHAAVDDAQGLIESGQTRLISEQSVEPSQ